MSPRPVRAISLCMVRQTLEKRASSSELVIPSAAAHQPSEQSCVTISHLRRNRILSQIQNRGLPLFKSLRQNIQLSGPVQMQAVQPSSEVWHINVCPFNAAYSNTFRMPDLASFLCSTLNRGCLQDWGTSHAYVSCGGLKPSQLLTCILSQLWEQHDGRKRKRSEGYGAVAGCDSYNEFAQEIASGLLGICVSGSIS